jgi:probable HAF family extracellular repeat protein
MSHLTTFFSRIALLVTAMVLVAVPGIAQTQASCTFKIFQLAADPTNPTLNEAFGVNDYGTVVGQATFPYPAPPFDGFIRYSNGGVKYYLAPNSFSTLFRGRNDGGVSVGTYSTQGTANVAKGFVLSGSTFTSFVHPKSVLGTTLTGINKFNSIVGWYLDASENAHGFKRYSNGGLTSINYPGAQATYANAINDTGAIVGSYTASNGTLHGFIYHGNQWATLDFPNTTGTELFGISNAGVILGLDHSPEQGRAFMYIGGGFKTIAVPGAFSTQANGIAPGGLLITGTTNLTGDQAGWRGFTASCH